MKYATLLLVVLFLVPVWARAQYTKVISVSPAQEGSCIAIEIPTPVGASIAGLRWFHNDGLQEFPRVVLVEGQAGLPPDLTNPGLILEEANGVSLGWGEWMLASPVTSSTGTAYAVFFYPPAVHATALGEGGGPGLGLRATEEENAAFYLSSDAQHFVRFDSKYELGVEPITVLGRGTVQTLSEVGSVIGLPGPTPEAPELPRVTELRAAVPNPFNPRVTLSFALASPSQVSLKVYDLRGRVVNTLVAGPRPAGEHTAIWEGVDVQGRSVGSGVYFVRFEADAVVQNQRIVLIR